jgi:hypothetical protein
VGARGPEWRAYFSLKDGGGSPEDMLEGAGSRFLRVVDECWRD